MKKVLSIVLLSAMLMLPWANAWAVDKRIQYTEEMVGANHPTKTDTLNRLPLVEHNTNGTHGAITPTTVNKVTITAPATGSTLTINEGKTLTVSSTFNTKDALSGDGVAGRILRQFRLNILNGTNASTIKVDAAALFNGDTIPQENNLAAGGNTGNFALSANGSVLTINATGVAGDFVAVLSITIYENDSQTLIAIASDITGTNAMLSFTNASTGAPVNLTTLVDTGGIYLKITYLTSA